MAEQVERARRAENRTRSELVREALRAYLSARAIRTELPTATEARAYRQGMAAYRRGNYVTLEAYLDGLDRRPRRARKKGS
jgi:Arc/MetJ-type ribon-helix-helix transcriptional regulator